MARRICAVAYESEGQLWRACTRSRMTDILRHRSAQRHGQTNGVIDVDPIQAHVDLGAFPQGERSMRRRLHALTGVLFLSMLLPCQAHAQVYELIKWCKGNWRTVVVC